MQEADQGRLISYGTVHSEGATPNNGSWKVSRIVNVTKKPFKYEDIYKFLQLLYNSEMRLSIPKRTDIVELVSLYLWILTKVRIVIHIAYFGSDSRKQHEEVCSQKGKPTEALRSKEQVIVVGKWRPRRTQWRAKNLEFIHQLFSLCNWELLLSIIYTMQSTCPQGYLHCRECTQRNTGSWNCLWETSTVNTEDSRRTPKKVITVYQQSWRVES